MLFHIFFAQKVSFSVSLIPQLPVIRLHLLGTGSLCIFVAKITDRHYEREKSQIFQNFPLPIFLLPKIFKFPDPGICRCESRLFLFRSLSKSEGKDILPTK